MSGAQRDPMTDPLVFDLTPRGAWASHMRSAGRAEEPGDAIAAALQAQSIATALLAQETRVANLIAVLGTDLIGEETREAAREELRRLFHWPI